ncbi:MAG: hypothetical protein VW875_11455 [Planctomycetaceae bacterium]
MRIEYLGREMMCNHCGGDFIADEGVSPEPQQDAAAPIIARVDALLDGDNTPGKPR